MRPAWSIYKEFLNSQGYIHSKLQDSLGYTDPVSNKTNRNMLEINANKNIAAAGFLQGKGHLPKAINIDQRKQDLSSVIPVHYQLILK